MMVEVASWADMARLRQGFYRFIGAAWLSPTDERIDMLVGGADHLHTLGVETFPFFLKWTAFLAELGRCVPNRLATEYVRLFASGMDGALCPPVESFYAANAKGGGIALVASNLDREYRSLGYLATGTTEPPDHLATELEVLSGMCGREAESWALEDLGEATGWMSREAAFLRRHPAAWFPAFRARVMEAETELYFVALAELGHAFVVHDLDFLNMGIRTLDEAS